MSGQTCRHGHALTWCAGCGDGLCECHPECPWCKPTPNDEREAADRYWHMIGADLPLEERAGRIRILTQHAHPERVEGCFRCELPPTC